MIVNKLRILRKLHDDDLFDCLSSAELRLFLLMITDSNESGEGELNLGYVGWLFDGKISQKGLENICDELQKKQLVQLTNSPGCGSSVIYQIRYHDGYLP